MEDEEIRNYWRSEDEICDRHENALALSHSTVSSLACNDDPLSSPDEVSDSDSSISDCDALGSLELAAKTQDASGGHQRCYGNLSPDFVCLVCNAVQRPTPPKSHPDFPPPTERTETGFQVLLYPYNPRYPRHFQAIREEIERYFTKWRVPYLRIEHIGSTSIPGIRSKPIIDTIVIVEKLQPFKSYGFEYIDKVHYALVWGSRKRKYVHIGDGGVRGRPSFKLQDRDDLPRRNVYLVEEGSMLHRGYVDFRDTLLDPANEDLKNEYAREKQKLTEAEWERMIDFARRKNSVVSKVLLRAGWTEAEVEERVVSTKVDRDEFEPDHPYILGVAETEGFAVE
ncbi:MAG: hypothetical protein Q9227_007764 [Pyrenula ochraceoflavens]